jgi:hypothetical protein
MEYLESSYKGTKDLNVILINDSHIGAPSANISLLTEVRDFALKNEENTRILLNGDYIEGIIKGSHGEPHDQKMSPKEQADYFVEFMYPVRHLIEGITEGNHDYRVEKATSFDVVEIIAKDLGIKRKYLGVSGVIGFSFNKLHYSIEMHHGVGGGSTLAAIENAMKRLWKTDSDVMYCGHWHKEFAKPIKRYSTNKRHKKMIEEKKWLICGNTILDTAKYAKRGGYEESFPSQAMLILDSKKKNIDVQWFR